MKNVYVDFHVIQTVPPSCLNRDDTGSPKTAVYGGVRRARVSSQAWKRAMRLMFREHFEETELGTRTKRIVDMVAAEIRAIAPTLTTEDAFQKAEAVVNLANVSTKDAQAKALFFMSLKQAKNLADLAVSKPDAKAKEAQAALNAGHGVDIALFGRMVADDPSLNADASAQVAHSISTHKADNEYDFFTAVDDLAPEDNAGAGMLGTVEFNSATLYRYATVAAHNLYKQLDNDGDALAKAVSEFARAFVTAMPTGKQNTFANRTLPYGVFVAIRGDQPVNLAGAFEAPIRAEGEGFAKPSAESLAHYAAAVYGDFCDAPIRAYTIGNIPFESAEPVTLAELIASLGAQVAKTLGDGT